MAAVVGRLRSWLASVEFAVTAVGVVVALAAGAVAFEATPETVDGYFLILLAGIAVPGIYENYWPEAYDSRVLGAVWALGACLGLLTVYVLVTLALGAVLDGFAPRAGAFATAWLVGIFTANAYAAGSA